MKSDKNNIVRITFNGKPIGELYENPTIAQRAKCLALPLISKKYKRI
jgi:hypothetical protein